MIELIIAMVLLAVALAAASATLVQQFAGSSGARAGAIADATLAKASTRFADDVGAARTDDLIGGELRDPVEFAAAVRRNERATSSNPATPSRVLDLDAVLRATGSELRLQVEADPNNAGVECVTWRAETGGGYRVVRLVDRQRACGTGTLGRETILSAPAGIPGLDTTPFDYELACNGCAGYTCSPSSVPTVPADRLRWVVAASFGIDVVSGATPASGRTKAVIRVRDTESYRRALGC